MILFSRSLGRRAPSSPGIRGLAGAERREDPIAMIRTAWPALLLAAAALPAHAAPPRDSASASIQVHFSEGAWTVGPAASTLADGPAECLVDEQGRAHAGTIEPARGWLAPNGYVGGNSARAGDCRSTTFTGPIRVLTFNTAGNAGGSVLLEGWDPLTGAYGRFEVWCAPAGSATGLGAVGVWRTSVQLQDADCHVSHDGLQPSSYVEWLGAVANHNTGPGQSTYALAH